MAQESHGGATWVPDIQRGTSARATDRQRSEEHQIQEGTGHMHWMYMSITHTSVLAVTLNFDTNFQDHVLLNSIEELRKKANDK